ncbi:MAG: hypothetical protein JW795_22225 [Chitinivibrionales bacterium]|nr:hypothetical protein [Chitinivibrionales bacterium]
MQHYRVQKISTLFTARQSLFKLLLLLCFCIASLQANQTPLIAWGSNDYSQSNVNNVSELVAVDAGVYFTIGLKSDSTVVAWGKNDFGQCDVPPDLKGVIAISAGHYHALALKSDSTVVAWGKNSDSQASPPSTLKSVIAISGGGSHSLALKSDGTVVGWGNNSDGQCTTDGINGVIAIEAGTTHSVVLLSDHTIYAWGDCSRSQCDVPPDLENVIAIASGFDHTIALKSDGNLAIWGCYYNYGQCSPPTGLSNVIAIAAGQYHSVALKSDGKVVAFGYNDGKVINVPADLNNVKAIAAGTFHTIALKSDHKAVAWGHTEAGQCIIPTDISTTIAAAGGHNHTIALQADGKISAWGINNYGQCDVAKDITFATAVAAGDYHSVALKSDSSVSAWGYNQFGQCNVPQNLDSAIAITAGQNHTVALKASGKVVAWGKNDFGQRTVPPYITNIIAIAAGANHTMALDSAGKVFCWGEPKFTPPADLKFIAIAANEYYCLGITTDHKVVAWGYSKSGVLIVPDGLNDVIAIAAGWNHAVALKANGSVIVWGDNKEKQLNQPENLTNVKSITAGYYHTLAIRSNTSEPPIPERINPLDNATGVPTNPLLIWKAVDQVQVYAVQLSTTANFNTPIVDRDDLTETSLQVEGLNYGATYYWRIKALLGDGDGPWSSIWKFIVKSEPQCPIASVIPEQAVGTLGVPIKIDGSASSDPDNEPITYHWSLRKPDGTTINNGSPNSTTYTFTPALIGTYTVKLRVTDEHCPNGDPTKGMDSAKIVVEPLCPSLVITLGTQNATVGAPVVLDACSSKFPAGVKQCFLWQIVLSNDIIMTQTIENSCTFTFIPKTPGAYMVSLRSCDQSCIEADTLRIVVKDTNRCPVSQVTPKDTTVESKAQVKIDGSTSFDPDGEILSYQWTLIPPVGAAIIGPVGNSTSYTFTPAQEGKYLIVLRVTDPNCPNGNSDTARVLCKINPCPIAKVLPKNASAEFKLPMKIDGSGSYDPDGEKLSYQWTLIPPVGTAVTTPVGNNSSYTFTPDHVGKYTVILSVTDPHCLNGTTDTTIIRTINPCPIAMVKPGDTTVASGAAVIIDGSGSYDPDGELLLFSWSMVTPGSTTPVVLPSTASTCTFKQENKGTYLVICSVSDPNCQVGILTSSDTAKIVVIDIPDCIPPVADAGEDQTTTVGDLVMLDGTSSKATVENCYITYDWTMIAKPKGSTAVLKYPKFDSPIFKADVKGTYVMQLVVIQICPATSCTDTDYVVVTAINNTFPGVVTTQLTLNDSVCVNQKITLKDSYNRSRLLTTDKEGWVRFRNVPPGRFNLIVKEKPVGAQSTIHGALKVNSQPVILGQVKVAQKGKPDIYVETDDNGEYQVGIATKGTIKIVISDIVPLVRTNPTYSDPGTQYRFEKPTFF